MNKKIFYSLAIFICTLAACTSGRDDVYNALPDIEIGNVTETGAVASEMFYGDTLTIKPTVQYGDQTDTANFEFRWYRQETNELKLLSEEPVFHHRMDSLGTWTIRLEVTDKATELMQSATVYIDIISKTERGWYVLKENEDGNTDMDLFQAYESGEIGDIDTDLLSQQDAVLQGKPVGLFFTDNFRWKKPDESYFTGNVPALVSVSEKDISALSVEEIKVLSGLDDLFFEKSNSSNYSFTGVVSSPVQNLLVDNGNAHLMERGMQAFLPVVPGDYSLSPYWTISDYSNGYMLGFDEASHSFVYVTDLAGDLGYFPDKYLNEKKSSISSNNMNGTISFLENTDGSLNDSVYYNQRAYALFHETGRTDRCILLGLDLEQIVPSYTDAGNAQYSPVATADTLSYATYPELKESSLFALDKSYGILYFAYGNKIGRYAIDRTDNKYNKDILTFPSGEEITYMHSLECLYDTNYFNYLIVATHTTDGQYKIYRYTMTGDNAVEVGDPLTGKGKVKSLVYVSPSSYYVVDYIYRYY